MLRLVESSIRTDDARLYQTPCRTLQLVYIPGNDHPDSIHMPESTNSRDSCEYEDLGAISKPLALYGHYAPGK
jgi:hypothetical protein